MEISLSPETIFHLGKFTVSNSMLTALLISLSMLIFAVLARRMLTTVPGRVQAALELTYESLIGIADSIIKHPAATREVTPYILTLFLFVLLSNWSGLLPGFSTIQILGEHHGQATMVPLLRAPTSDLNMTAALALISVSYVQYLGLKHAGVKMYVGRFFNFHNPIGFFVGILELIGEVARLISFSFRLFGNVFAGEVLISVMFLLTITLLPYIAILPLPFFFLELFVGIIQAFVFAFLTILFVSLAVVSHDTEGHTHGGEDLNLAHLAAEDEDNLIDHFIHPNHIRRSV